MTFSVKHPHAKIKNITTLKIYNENKSWHHQCQWRFSIIQLEMKKFLNEKWNIVKGKKTQENPTAFGKSTFRIGIIRSISPPKSLVYKSLLKIRKVGEKLISTSAYICLDLSRIVGHVEFLKSSDLKTWLQIPCHFSNQYRGIRDTGVGLVSPSPTNLLFLLRHKFNKEESLGFLERFVSLLG